MASKRQLVFSSTSSDSDQESSRETSDSFELTEKQKLAKESHPDEEDASSKDAGKGKRKSEEKSLPEDDTASKDAPNHAEKQRSGEQCQPVNAESHSDAGKKAPPMINSSEHEKDSAATDSDASTPPKKSSSRALRKRPLESESNQRRSKSKRLKKESNEENAMKPFQRVWTEKDEIVILNGMIDYKDEKGENPSSNLGAFYHYILESVSFICTKIQLKEKIRRLKDKYLKKANKDKYLKKTNKGENTFSTPHEDQVFRLSKKIWGKQKVKTTEVGEEVNVNIPIRKSLGVASLEAEIIAVGLDVVEGPEKKALEKRWKSLRIAELKAFLVRNQIVADQAKLLLDYYKTC